MRLRAPAVVLPTVFPVAPDSILTSPVLGRAALPESVSPAGVRPDVVSRDDVVARPRVGDLDPVDVVPGDHVALRDRRAADTIACGAFADLDSDAVARLRRP